MKRTFALCAVAVLLAGYACSSSESTSPVTGTGRQMVNGSLKVGLEVAPGVMVSSVDYKITGSGMDAMTGTFALNGGQGSGFIGVVDHIPAGTGRQIDLTANASNGTTCKGSGTFDVQSGETTIIDVILECRDSGGTVIVRGTFEQCPLLKSVSAAPDSVAVGDKIYLDAVASDPVGDPLKFAWTATSGTFADASAATTTYTCTQAGTQTITAKVSKEDGSCSDSTSFDVTCKPATDAGGGTKCGNGVIDSGEDCDKDALGGATCASATMNALPNGVLACSANCMFDTSGCSSGGNVGGAGGTGGTDAGAAGSGGTAAGGSMGW